MLPIMGGLISGGASLISGLFGMSSAKKQARKEEDAIREANRVASENAENMNIFARARADAAALVPRQMSRGVDTEAFMADAERMGFNPLTFLRSGALSAYEWTCDTGSGAMQAAEAGQYIPQLAPVLAQTKVPSLGDVFGSALVSGAGAYMEGANQQNLFQQEVLMQQLRGAQTMGAYDGMRSFSTPQAFLRSDTGATGKRAAMPDGSPGNPFPLEVYYIDAKGKLVPALNPNFPDNDQYGGLAAALGVEAAKRLAADAARVKRILAKELSWGAATRAAKSTIVPASPAFGDPSGYRPAFVRPGGMFR